MRSGVPEDPSHTACDRTRTQTQAGLIPDLTPLGDFVFSSDFSKAQREYWQLMSKIYVAVLIDSISLVMYKQSDFIFLNNCYQPYSASLNPTSWHLKKMRKGREKTNLPYNSVFIPSDSFLITFSICSCHFLIIKKCHCPIQRHLLHIFHETQQQGWECPAYEWLVAPSRRTGCCPIAHCSLTLATMSATWLAYAGTGGGQLPAPYGTL